VDSKPVAASDIAPDILDLASQIAKLVEELVSAVETLDGNKWLGYADKILNLNDQLQELLVPSK
jgi:hypothetical protein